MDSPLPLLLAWFAVPLVFGAWNALLARYAYAAGDTRQPLRCELLGSLVNVLLLGALPFVFGLAGIPLAALAGVICTALLLMQRQGLLGGERVESLQRIADMDNDKFTQAHLRHQGDIDGFKNVANAHPSPVVGQQLADLGRNG